MKQILKETIDNYLKEYRNEVVEECARRIDECEIVGAHSAILKNLKDDIVETIRQLKN